LEKAEGMISAMHLDLTEVLSGPGGTVEKTIDIPAGTPLDEWELTEPVVGWVRASNARRNIVVRGKAKTAVQLECGRCLQSFSQPLDLELDVTVPLATFNNQLGAAAVSDDDSYEGQELTQEDVQALFQEHHLDVSELVRQAIVLAVPIQPLDRPDCPGLPEAEKYNEEPVDPRWAALQNLDGLHQNGGDSNGIKPKGRPRNGDHKNVRASLHGTSGDSSTENVNGGAGAQE
jgi:uncharacterized protein